uniref:Uncharacterized protein n=1 Tax=Plectus sambesii TaxID=2011161 RepID=A0A914WLY0_9BILA
MPRFYTDPIIPASHVAVNRLLVPGRSRAQRAFGHGRRDRHVSTAVKRRSFPPRASCPPPPSPCAPCRTVQMARYLPAQLSARVGGAPCEAIIHERFMLVSRSSP